MIVMMLDDDYHAAMNFYVGPEKGTCLRGKRYTLRNVS
jgi:hypothetical protein